MKQYPIGGSAPAYTYIIAPLGVIPVNELPKHIGLIEVDLDNFSMRKYINKLDSFTGVKITKKVRKHIDERFETEDIYRQWCADLLD